MKNKIFVFVISLLLLFSGLTVAAQGEIANVEGNEDTNKLNNEVDDKDPHECTLTNSNTCSENQVDNRKKYCQNSVLVKLEPLSESLLRTADSEEILRTQVNNLLSLVEGSTYRLYPSFNMAEISLQEGKDVMNAIEVLTSREEVVYAEPNYLVETSEIPNDPGYDSLWGMEKIDAPGAWNVTTGSEDVVVAVLDTGIDYNHPDLMENMWTSDEGYHGYNAVNDSYDPMDDNGHGTHVAGTIGAVGNNNLGVVGVNWNVSLMGVKALNSTGVGNTGDVISGLEYVLERRKEGENIVATSNSWGGDSRSQLLYEAIQQHQEEGILFVISAGNKGSNNDKTSFYPANYDLTNIISVAATDQNDNLAGFSNYGKRSVHIGAPGVNINSTMLDGNYSYASGTSMAAPHVSGLAALLASHNTSYDYNNLKNIIIASADSSDPLLNRTMADGRINASSSLKQSPDPDDINFWVHRPYSTMQLGEKTRIMISLNDGVNPILGADVRVEFSTGESDVQLIDNGSEMDQVADDGYYTGGWRPQKSGQVILNITVRLEDREEKLSKNVTVNVRTIHPETYERILEIILSFLREIIKTLRELLNLSFNATYGSKCEYLTHPLKPNIPH